MPASATFNVAAPLSPHSLEAKQDLAVLPKSSLDMFASDVLNGLHVDDDNKTAGRDSNGKHSISRSPTQDRAPISSSHVKDKKYDEEHEEENTTLLSTAKLKGKGKVDIEFERSSQERDNEDTLTLQESCGNRKIYPHPAVMGPINVKNLTPGKEILFCTCGLSKRQPFCDWSHIGTKFKPLAWEVPGGHTDHKMYSLINACKDVGKKVFKKQAMYSFCGCKYTKTPPFCDATHTSIACEIVERQKACEEDGNHVDCGKLCTGCGYAPEITDW